MKVSQITPGQARLRFGSISSHNWSEIDFFNTLLEIIVGRRRFIPPYDIYRPFPPPDGVELEIGAIDGRPAAFERPRRDTKAGGARITVASDGILTIIVGTVATDGFPDFDELMRVAESMFR